MAAKGSSALHRRRTLSTPKSTCSTLPASFSTVTLPTKTNQAPSDRLFITCQLHSTESKGFWNWTIWLLFLLDRCDEDTPCFSFNSKSLLHMALLVHLSLEWWFATRPLISNHILFLRLNSARTSAFLNMWSRKMKNPCDKKKEKQRNKEK